MTAILMPVMAKHAPMAEDLSHLAFILGGTDECLFRFILQQLSRYFLDTSGCQCVITGSPARYPALMSDVVYIFSNPTYE
ncbi:MAG: hypothetical protein ACTSUE_21085 [Promethearchaeota archaeon]